MLAIKKASSKKAKILSKAKLITNTKLTAIKSLYSILGANKAIKNINNKAIKSTKATKASNAKVLKATSKVNTKTSAIKPNASKASIIKARKANKVSIIKARKASTTKANAAKSNAIKAKASANKSSAIKASKSSILSKASNKALITKAKTNNKAIKAKSTAKLVPSTKKYISLRTANLIPTKNTIIGRFIVENVDSYTRANAGQQALLPLILALFLVIAISNTLSNVPYGYAAASSLSFSLGLSLTVFIAVTASALTLLGVTWFAHFALDSPSFLAPILVLIETISYSARAVSLGVRLFANLVAGHALLNIISKMGKQSILSKWFLLPLIVLPTAILGVIIVLELAVAQIQAYVFTVLTTIYDSESKEKPIFDLH